MKCWPIFEYADLFEVITGLGYIEKKLRNL